MSRPPPRLLSRPLFGLLLLLLAAPWAPAEARPRRAQVAAPERFALGPRPEQSPELRRLQELLTQAGAGPEALDAARAVAVFTSAETSRAAAVIDAVRAAWAERCAAAPPCGPDPLSEPDGVEAAATLQAWRGARVDAWQAVVELGPREPGVDLALGELARALEQAARRDEALTRWTAIVRGHPDSELVAEAYTRIGDYYFDANSAFKALSAYLRAATYEGAPTAEYAKWRLAWCYYNVGEYRKALETDQALYTRLRGQGPAADLRLFTAIEQDLCVIFADMGALDEALAWAEREGRPPLWRCAAIRSATLRRDQGKFSTAAAIFEQLVDRHPLDPEAPAWSQGIVACAHALGDAALVAVELEAARARYAAGTPWAEANGAAAVEAAAAILRDPAQKGR